MSVTNDLINSGWSAGKKAGASAWGVAQILGPEFGNSVWNNLKFHLGNISVSAATIPFIDFRKKKHSAIVFKNPGVENIWVQRAKRIVHSSIGNAKNTLVSDYVNKQMQKRRAEAYEKFQQAKSESPIIKDYQAVKANWGRVGDYEALDRYGRLVPESLMLYYDTGKTFTVENPLATGQSKKSFQTSIVCHIDLAPKVTMSSTKNIVLTDVQGRDFSRKELVSGGDYKFSVSGKIVSNEPDVYPTNEVKKFVQVMEYGGIVNVHFMFFEQLNVKRVIIQDFSLGAIENFNEQPYTFNCVAVEPDDVVQITKDTISAVNIALESSPANEWYDHVLERKLAEITTNAVVQTAQIAAGIGLDELLSKI